MTSNTVLTIIHILTTSSTISSRAPGVGCRARSLDQQPAL